MKEYDTSYGMNVRCADLLPMLLPKGLVVQEEKMKTVIQNAWDENLKLHAFKSVKTQGRRKVMLKLLKSLDLVRRRLNTGVFGINEVVT